MKKPAIGQRWKYTVNDNFFITEIDEISEPKPGFEPVIYGRIIFGKGFYPFYPIGLRQGWSIPYYDKWQYLPGQDKV